MRIDERAAAKGQGFTLLIFGGLVVLCSIFFILGMVVARPGDPAPAALGAAGAPDMEDGALNEDDDLDLTFYETVEEVAPPPIETPDQEVSGIPAPVAPPPALDPLVAGDSSEPAPGRTVIVQVAALSNPQQAERLRSEIAAMGLPAFVLRPSSGDALHRVQVGPFTEATEVDRVRALLVREGYDPIVRD